MSSPRSYEGKCHCGVIGFVFRTALEQLPAAAPMHYDGEGTAERLARREQRWTPLTSA